MRLALACFRFRRRLRRLEAQIDLECWDRALSREIDRAIVALETLPEAGV
jgi:hypothetical protein